MALRTFRTFKSPFRAFINLRKQRGFYNERLLVTTPPLPFDLPSNTHILYKFSFNFFPKMLKFVSSTHNYRFLMRLKIVKMNCSFKQIQNWEECWCWGGGVRMDYSRRLRGRRNVFWISNIFEVDSKKCFSLNLLHFDYLPPLRAHFFSDQGQIISRLCALVHLVQCTMH